MDMYTSEVTGHYRFVQNGPPPPCACQRCVRFDLGHGNHHHGGVQTPRQMDHPAFWDQTRRDGLAEPWAKDPARRTVGDGGLERSCHRSPQRRPVFVGTVQCNHTSPVRSYEMPPGHCNCNMRHVPPLREQCGCTMVRSDARVFSFGVPHPLPHLQVKGQKGYNKPCRTVRYRSVEDDDYTSDRGSYEPQLSPQMGYLQNGHCGMGTFGGLEGGEERDTHQDWSRGGSEHGCNGHGGFYKGFFSTEVPPKHLNPTRRKNGPCISPSSGTQGLKLNGEAARTGESPESGDHRRKDAVREQIRQVVTNLEDVLGGLKQVHVEMKEVVEQIDRLTANIDLSEETPGITHQGADRFDINALDFLDAPPGDRRPQMPRLVDEERVILRTNSPSAIHTASVVKTSRIVPPLKQNGLKNGHPPQLFNANHAGVKKLDANHTGHAAVLTQEPPLDPKVIIETRTQKPPPYPQNGQNGRCGKYPPPLVKPARTPPANPGRGRQSSSVV